MTWLRTLVLILSVLAPAPAPKKIRPVLAEDLYGVWEVNGFTVALYKGGCYQCKGSWDTEWHGFWVYKDGVLRITEWTWGSDRVYGFDVKLHFDNGKLKGSVDSVWGAGEWKRAK